MTIYRVVVKASDYLQVDIESDEPPDDEKVREAIRKEFGDYEEMERIW